MKKNLIYVLLVTWMVILPMGGIEALAGCEEACSGQCEYLGSGPEWAACMESCVRDCLRYDPPEVPTVPEPVPEGPGDIPSDQDNLQEPSPDHVRQDSLHRRVVAQNENFVPCYKEKDFKQVLFRWCPKDKPWTPTHEMRNFCYSTLEDCAAAEMPQTWCIRCEQPQKN